jgi:7-cyano-7-deazaguanine synthase in queuosine biosynthesis
MRRHTILCRLGASDTERVVIRREASHVTEISFVDGHRRLSHGLGEAIDWLQGRGLQPSEKAVDLALLAAVLTAADTRVSRSADAEDGWTRQIGLHLPVSDVALWSTQSARIVAALNFLTGDRWELDFRPRPPGFEELVPAPKKLRTVNPSCVCLFSGGLDSFIGAIDLLAAKEAPLFVSHWWDGITSKHQAYCARALEKHFDAKIDYLRVRVGFSTDTVADSSGESTLRGRSFLFFSLAALAASAIGGSRVVHVPENGWISLNVPLDPLRVGALSTRTTHPYFIARFNELVTAIGIDARLENSYRHQTKGQMVTGCSDKAFLRREAKNTMSCSSPAKARFSTDESKRTPQHCGYCVPCLIRRASLLQGLGADDTQYGISNLRARVLDTNRAEGEHVRSFQLALARLKKKPERARFDIHKPGPLSDHPNDLAAYERVYVDGLKEVASLLERVRAKPL